MAVSNWVRGVGSVFQRIGGGVKCSRKFKVAGNSPHVASVDVLEERLLLTADFGDAPDTTAGTGANNYQTLASHGGPSHVIDTTQTNLFLGGRVDGEAGTQQSAAANLDNLFAAGGRNDEDGVMSSLDLTATIGSSPRITLSATNTTGTAVTLYGCPRLVQDPVHLRAADGGVNRLQTVQLLLRPAGPIHPNPDVVHDHP